MRIKPVLQATLFALLVLVVSSLAVSAKGPTGAIFTTVPDGSIVNENVRYDSKLEVYLDGGPGPNAPSTSAGLDAGLYVFQVTDPSGGALLSQDPARCRIVRVSTDGVIVELVPPTSVPGLGATSDNWSDAVGSQPCHIQDGPDGVAGPSGSHDTNTDIDHAASGAIVVQLMPFLDTPNPGGEYKAWMTPIGAYLGKGGDLNETPNEFLNRGGNKIGFQSDIGFGGSRDILKTDNFKVLLETPPEEIPANLIIEKRDATTNELVGGAVFSVSPHPFNCGEAGPLSVTDDDANDSNPAAGIIELAGVCTPETYTVIETQAPPGYVLVSDELIATFDQGTLVQTVTSLNPPDGDLPVCTWELAIENDGPIIYWTITDTGAGVDEVYIYFLMNATLEILDGPNAGQFLIEGESTTFTPAQGTINMRIAPTASSGQFGVGMVVTDAAGNATPEDDTHPCDPIWTI